MEQEAPAGARSPKYFLTLPGLQSAPIGADLGEDEEALRDALAPIVAGIGNAEFAREERDGEVHIHVTLRAGRKGCHDNCPHNAPPASEPPPDAAAPKKRRVFRKTTFKLTVLSVDDEGPRPAELNLEAVYNATIDGDYSGETEVAEETTVTAAEMAELLKAQGSDPAFFDLADDGTDLWAAGQEAAALREEADGYEDEYIIRGIFRRPPSASSDDKVRRELTDQLQRGYDDGPLSGSFDTRELTREEEGISLAVVFTRYLERDADVACEEFHAHAFGCALNKQLERELGECSEKGLLDWTYSLAPAELTPRESNASRDGGELP